MNVVQRRRLTDLYANGEEITVGEGGDAQQVWIRKMTPADAEVAYLKANARRSSVLAQEREEEPGDFFISLKAEIAQLSKDNLIDWLIDSEMVNQTPVVEARLAEENEWTKENYLGSLRERFLDEDFQTLFTEVPDDPEVKRVMSELSRFHNEVADEVAALRADLRATYEYDSIEELQGRVLHESLVAQSEAAWLEEFYNCQVWRCTFWADTREPVFKTRAEVDDLQAKTSNQLREAIERIHVSDAEGKG